MTVYSPQTHPAFMVYLVENESMYIVYNGNLEWEFI